METKRFIGNDMPRIYERVRREFGPDAVIVRTRSLLREGAEPLIEVLAAAPESEHELTLDLQSSLIGGALARVQSSRELTIGDLEDLVAREAAYEARDTPPPTPLTLPLSSTFHRPHLRASQSRRRPPPYPRCSKPPGPDPIQAILDELRGRPDALPPQANVPVPKPAPARRFPQLPDVDPNGPPANDWASRPRPAIITRTRRPDTTTEAPAAMHPLPTAIYDTQVPRSLHAQLTAAGLSARAADTIIRSAANAEPADALAAALALHEATYPDEGRTALISIQGAPGAGRTTALMRMALDCADSGRRALLLAADGSHTAGREQVRAYGDALGIEVIDVFEPGDVVRAAGQAPRGTCLFVDVPSGPWHAPAMPGVQHFAYAALPAHWQPEPVRTALHDLSATSLTGAVLTFTDLATSLSPVLSLVVESGLGLAFLSSSRDVGAGIAVADPAALASGIFTTPTRESTDGRLVATA